MVAPLKDSNPQPPAPLGSAPAPRAPRVLPPLSALPLTPAPPGSLCSGSVAGSGDVAARRGAAASCRRNASIKRSSAAIAIDHVAACLPRTSRKKRAFPPHERRRCLCRGGVFPPCMRHRRSACANSLCEAPRAPSVAFCIVQDSVLPFGHAPCVCFNGRENRGRGALSPPLESHEKSHEGLPRVCIHVYCTVASARRERTSAIERVWLQVRCDGRVEKHARDVRADSAGDDRWQTRDSHTVHHAARARRTVVCKGRGERLSGEMFMACLWRDGWRVASASECARAPYCLLVRAPRVLTAHFTHAE